MFILKLSNFVHCLPSNLLVYLKLMQKKELIFCHFTALFWFLHKLDFLINYAMTKFSKSNEILIKHSVKQSALSCESRMVWKQWTSLYLNIKLNVKDLLGHQQNLMLSLVIPKLDSSFHLSLPFFKTCLININ